MQNNLKEEIKKLIGEYTFTDTELSVGIYAVNSGTNKIFSLNEDAIFGAASIIKVPIALAVFEKAQRGELDLNRQIKISKYIESLSAGKYTNGALAFIPEGGTVTLMLALFFMLHLSDNPAANFVLNFVTVEEVNAFLENNGFTKTRLTAQKIEPARFIAEENYFGDTTAEESAKMFGMIAKDKLLSKENSGILKRMLETDYPDKSFNQYLPIAWNVPDEEVKIKKLYDKNGSFYEFELRADAFSAVTIKDEILSFAIFVKGIVNKDGKKLPANVHPDHPASKFIGRVSRLLFDHLY